MFYVVGNKIYLAEHDGKVYPEVKLRVDSEGNFYFEKASGGLPKKPVKRQVMSKEEIIVKMGSSLMESEVPEESEE